MADPSSDTDGEPTTVIDAEGDPEATVDQYD